MAGRFRIVFACLMVAGFMGVIGWLQGRPGGDAAAFRHVPAGPTSPAELVSLASGLGLHWRGWPEGSQPHNHVIVSTEPLSAERLDRLNMHHPDFERWRGIVSISPCAWQILNKNYDPAHPERFAVWGNLVLFGDPELIARLMPQEG